MSDNQYLTKTTHFFSETKSVLSIQNPSLKDGLMFQWLHHMYPTSSSHHEQRSIIGWCLLRGIWWSVQRQIHNTMIYIYLFNYLNLYLNYLMFCLMVFRNFKGKSKVFSHHREILVGHICKKPACSLKTTWVSSKELNQIPGSATCAKGERFNKSTTIRINENQRDTMTVLGVQA